MTDCEDVRIELEEPDYEAKMDMEAPENGVAVEIKVPESGTDYYDKYEGSYEVTPRLAEQKLLTAKKLMADNLVVREIPITCVTNASGGNTIIIG